jgi:hypothetical protein
MSGISGGTVTAGYGTISDASREGRALESSSELVPLVAASAKTLPDQQVAALFYQLLGHVNYWYHGNHVFPESNPVLPPEVRMKRHRNFYIYLLNEFRHWWKTSRLLARLAGGFCFLYNDPLSWSTVLANLGNAPTRRHKQLKQASKYVKQIGRGGPLASFLNIVTPGTRTIRIVLAVARAWEARVDHRFREVAMAEALYVP